MHCTWFNEKKSSFPPYIFLCFFFFSSNTSPHLLSPSSPLACPSQRLMGTERPPPPCPPGQPRRRAPSRPSWPAASDLAGAGAPQTPAPAGPHARSPDCLRGKGQMWPGGVGGGWVPSTPLSALTLFSQPN